MGLSSLSDLHRVVLGKTARKYKNRSLPDMQRRKHVNGAGANKMTSKKQYSCPVIYHIRVQGKLDEKWGDWFGEFAMATRESGETLLSGSVTNQAELFGILVKINNLGLPLLMLMRVDCPCSVKKCTRHGNCQECVSHYNTNGTMPFCFRTNTKWNKQCLRLLEKKEK